MICQTPHFLVIPDIGPLVEGHLLIVPRQHDTCFGSLVRERWLEIQQLKDHVTRLLTESYSPPLFFEHGAARTRRAGNSIDHAHLHCLPGQVELPAIARAEDDWKSMASLADLSAYAEKNIPYLYYEDCQGRKFSCALENESRHLPSQYLRRVFGEALASPYWDWKEMIADEPYRDFNKKRILETVQRLKALQTRTGWQLEPEA